MNNHKRLGFYILKKIGRMLLLLFGVSFLTFLLVVYSPIDPLQVNVGQNMLGSMSQEQIEQVESYWEVDKPLHVRYITSISNLAKGDMGVSLLYRMPVTKVIGAKLRVSFVMLFFAWLMGGLLGVFLGIVAGVNQGKIIDKLIKGYSLLIASTPVFWLALLLLLIFGVYLQILPIGFSIPVGISYEDVTFLEKCYHGILPALTLSITGISNIALHTREKMILVMESDYMLYAKARGESLATRIKRHGIRNILLPAITLQFASIGELIGGSVLVEQVFSYPGLGNVAVTAGLGGDIPLLLGITLLCAFMVFFGNFIADILYLIIDPRMRKQYQYASTSLEKEGEYAK